ncbi:MAG: hypothetical protein AAFO94_19915, partial [Bacteroidota bacterium]
MKYTFTNITDIVSISNSNIPNPVFQILRTQLVQLIPPAWTLIRVELVHTDLLSTTPATPLPY